MGCNGPRVYYNCTYKHEENVQNVNNPQEASIVNDVVSNIPQIYVSLEDHEEDHQSTMHKFEGKIIDIVVSILIDSISSLRYIEPQVIENCKLHKDKQLKPWLVQLATRTKRKLSDLVKECNLPMNDMNI